METLIRNVIAIVGVLGVVVAALAYLGWDREKVKGLIRLLFRRRHEYLTIPGATVQRWFATESERLFLPNNQHGLQYLEIEGGTGGLELKEGDTCEIDLKPWTSSLVVAGWGMVTTRKHFGAVLDEGTIGHIIFHNRKRDKAFRIPVMLPKTPCEQDALRFGDVNPLISGNPPDFLTRAKGLIAVRQALVIPGSPLSFKYGNIWIDDIEVPAGTRFAQFQATTGNVHLVSVVAIRRLRRQGIANENQETPGQPDSTALRDKLKKLGSLWKAEALQRQGEEKSEKLRDLAYLYDDGEERKQYLLEAGLMLIKMARRLKEHSGSTDGIESADLFVDACSLQIRGQTYLYQAEKLTYELTEELTADLSQMAEKYVKQDPPSLADAFRFWDAAGIANLRYAQQAACRDHILHAMDICYDMWFKRIIHATQDLPSPSEGQLDDARQKCLVLEQWLTEFHITGWKVEVVRRCRAHLEHLLNEVRRQHVVRTS